MFLAPDQSQYTSRRSAYQALIKQVIDSFFSVLILKAISNRVQVNQNLP